MKKIISFEKEIDFPSMIGEITAISLDNNLDFINSSVATGKFIISGTYKMTEASTIDEEFSYDIPVEIELSEKLDLETVKISIDDFNYSIVNDDSLKCNIDILVEGVEEVELEEVNEEVEVLSATEERECDGDKKCEKELEVEEDIENDESINDMSSKIDKKEINKNTIITNKSSPKKEEKKEEKIIKKEEKIKMTDSIDQDTVDITDSSLDGTNISSLFDSFESAEETFTTYSVYILRNGDTLDKVLDMYKVNKEQLSDYNDLSNLEIGSKIIIPTCNE